MTAHGRVAGAGASTVTGAAAGTTTGTASATPTGSVAELLIEAAAKSPGIPAIRTPERSITWGELLEQARAVAGELRRAGAAPGTVVAVRLPNGPEWLVAYWGATLNGNVVAPISPRATRIEVEAELERTRAIALRSEEGLRSLASDVLSRTSPASCVPPAPSAFGASPGTAGEPDFDAVAPAGGASSGETPRAPCEAIHLVQLTSGSTGEPKGAMLTHRGLLSAARYQAQAWGLAAGEAVFVPNPFCHVLGLVYGVLMPAVARCTVLTLERFDLAEAIDLLVGGRAVAMTGAPTHLQMLAEQVEESGVRLPDLRLALTGGAAMAPAWIDRVRRILGVEALINGYGMSEVGSIAHTRLDDPPDLIAASVGFLVPGLEGRIVDPERGVEVPDGEVGELWLRGPSVMRGYLRDEARTREVLVPGGAARGGEDPSRGPWLRTRDLMRRDPTGRLSFVGRLDEMFTVGGFNVHPGEVERALMAHPDVAQAAVVPRADGRLGNVPVAFVRARGAQLDPAAVLASCRERLRGYLVPRRLVVLEELPLNRAGKVDKLALARRAERDEVGARRRRCAMTIERRFATPASPPPGRELRSPDRLADPGNAAASPQLAGGPGALELPGLELPGLAAQSERGSYFVAAYPPFSQWTADALEDYRRAREQPESAPAPSLGLYVHIPFCVDRCRYCYYLSYDRAGRTDRADDRGDLDRGDLDRGDLDRGALDRYVDALVAELATYAERPAIAGRELDFVYFGGGTPSLLSRSALERLFAGLQSALPLTGAREVTFECTPRSVTPAKMELLRAVGVTRLSLGVQQLDDEVLARNGRVHLVRHVEAAYDAIRRAGFPIVNLDLMVGLVGETEVSLMRSLERVIGMDPESVTIYQMEIPPNTPLYRDLESGRQSAGELADWEEKHRRLTLAFDRLAAAGYSPISAYAMVRDPERHPFLYQREQYHGADLLGIGASAFGYVQGVHHQNAASLRRYVEAVEAGELPLDRAYRLDHADRLVREVVLQLKLGRLDRGELRERFGVDVLDCFLDCLEPLLQAGWLTVDGNEIRLTPLGVPRVDHLIPAFYREAHRGVRYS